MGGSPRLSPTRTRQIGVGQSGAPAGRGRRRLDAWRRRNQRDRHRRKHTADSMLADGVVRRETGRMIGLATSEGGCSYTHRCAPSRLSKIRRCPVWLHIATRHWTERRPPTGPTASALREITIGHFGEYPLEDATRPPRGGRGLSPWRTSTLDRTHQVAAEPQRTRTPTSTASSLRYPDRSSVPPYGHKT